MDVWYKLTMIGFLGEKKVMITYEQPLGSSSEGR
jgi:hypothetical protein